MPVEDFTDINLGSDEKSFDELDRQAAKSIKTLEKRNKELRKTQKALDAAQKIRDSGTGIFQNEKSFPGNGAPSDIQNIDLSKKDKAIEKKLKKLQAKIKKDEVKQLGDKSSFLEDVLGRKTAKNIFDMGKNPVGFLTGIAKTIPFLGGVFAAKEIADFIVDEIAKLDKFLKKFVDVAERRTDLVRTRMEQANILAGLTQKIITTSSGGADPRESYNTFQMFNENQSELESNFAVQNNSGVK